MILNELYRVHLQYLPRSDAELQSCNRNRPVKKTWDLDSRHSVNHRLEAEMVIILCFPWVLGCRITRELHPEEPAQRFDHHV